jgi:hypothetical protein
VRALGRHCNETCPYFGGYLHNRLDDGAAADLDLHTAMLVFFVHYDWLLRADVEPLDANSRRNEIHNCFDMSNRFGAYLGTDWDKQRFELAGASPRIDETIQIIPQE